MTSLLRLGYACINTELRKQGIFSSRTCRIATLKKNPKILQELIILNLNDLLTILEWNVQHSVSLFRISSGLFPFMSHPEFGYDLSDWEEELKLIGSYAKEHKLRLTMHVGQWTLLNSVKEDVVQRSIKDLEMHSEILDKLGCDQDSVIVIHGGRKNGQEDFVRNFKRLNKSTQKRIALENCELSYKVEDLLPICEELRVPLILDYHHFNLNHCESLTDLMPRILNTWYKRGIRPKFHLSESCEDAKPGSITSLRKHSNLIKSLPENLPEDGGIDLMLEAKLKEQSVFLLREKYNL